MSQTAPAGPGVGQTPRSSSGLDADMAAPRPVLCPPRTPAASGTGSAGPGVGGSLVWGFLFSWFSSQQKQG